MDIAMDINQPLSLAADRKQSGIKAVRLFFSPDNYVANKPTTETGAGASDRLATLIV